MKVIEVLEILTDYAKKYRKDSLKSIKRSNHMNNLKGDEEVSQDIIDALLVDFINYIGAKSRVDYALYTSDIV